VTEAFPGFAGFRDEEDAPFFRSAIRAFDSPEATAAEILRSFSRVVFARDGRGIAPSAAPRA
jgi:hypothetical protein